ncbi:hypothetical protein POM88_031290 [Heracleum sosnowskyi]|uniref:Endonuclease/exonuclease/phosphatase domain-containing protein n=1 Tax=Heracleum sosnowskyi TaxID=360622 RepID=A0AAD8HX45_9APIA|nr:hypothetical protein POM88_031290 [Heracleum sosnowskyi]
MMRVPQKVLTTECAWVGESSEKSKSLVDKETKMMGVPQKVVTIECAWMGESSEKSGSLVGEARLSRMDMQAKNIGVKDSGKVANVIMTADLNLNERTERENMSQEEVDGLNVIDPKRRRVDEPIIGKVQNTIGPNEIDKLEWLRRKLGFEGLFTVDPQGRSGGLALLWKEAEHVNLLGFSQNHIDVTIPISRLVSWQLTGCYREPDRAQRRKTWDLLRHLSRDSNVPWCVIGDLNNVSSQDDKRGGAPYLNWLVEGFNETLMEVGLSDMDLVGHQFTWERGRGTDEWMEVRLDKALVTENWLEVFSLAKLYNLEISSSDHNPILLVPKKVEHQGDVYRFKFENAWLIEPMCSQLVREGWDNYGIVDIQNKVKICGEKLGVWGKDITSHFGKRIKACKTELKQLINKRDIQSQQRYKEVRKNLCKIF